MKSKVEIVIRHSLNVLKLICIMCRWPLLHFFLCIYIVSHTLKLDSAFLHDIFPNHHDSMSV